MTRKPRGKRRAGRRGRGGNRRLGLWAGVCFLALAVAGVGAYLARQLPRSAEPVARQANPAVPPRLEELLGPLGAAGVRVRVAGVAAARELAERVSAAVGGGEGGAVTLEPWVQTAEALLGAVTVGGGRYPVRLEWPAPVPPRGGQLAIVIDDMGRNLALEQQFLDLPLEITPSLLPYLRHTGDVAALAADAGREYLLHLPMQPQGYPRQNPGRGAILEGMTEAQVRAGVRALLDAVPGVGGANNHMGSRLTELRGPMAWVLEELRARGLYFLDSVTTGDSVGAEVARELGMGWGRRDVFLDNVQDAAAVEKQLDRAASLARKNGAAVAIGHPHRATLQALQRWAPKLSERGVRVVPMGRLVRRGDGA